jgi:endonuclease-3
VPESADTPEKIEAELDRRTPEEYKPFVSNYLVLFGRYACTARNPKCGGCGLGSLCKFHSANAKPNPGGRRGKPGGQ